MRKVCLFFLGLIMFARISYALSCANPTILKVDSIGDVGRYCSFIAPNYQFLMPNYVSYYDSTNGNLKLAGGFASFSYAIDTLGDVGKFTSIGTWEDSSGGTNNMVISYYDVTNENLKCAWGKGSAYNYDSTFELFTIDSIGNVGQFTSTYVDTLNKTPYISYYDVTNGDLKLAYFKDSVWNIEKIDTAGDVGEYNSISGYIDTIYISYYDATNGDLKLAKYGGTNWQIEKIDTVGDVGKYSAMYALGGVLLYIGYYDATNGDLKEADRNSSLNWTIEKTDTLGDVGLFVCKKHYSTFYYDKTNGDLRGYGILDSIGDVGQYASGESGLGYIVYYYDATNGDLKVAGEGDAIEEYTNHANNNSLKITPNFSSKNFSISYALKVASTVNLKVFNVTGKVVEVLANEKQNAGEHSIMWKPNKLPNGIYFVRLTTCNYKETKKLTILK